MTSLFYRTGVHVMAGGQFGSEGKGALAAWLALKASHKRTKWGGVITSAGPNSGHTSYFNDTKIVLKQLPTFAVHMHLRGLTIPVYFSAGAVIDAKILLEEHSRYPNIPIFIHPCAALLSHKDMEEERKPEGLIFQIAGTRSGTGAVLARKIHRDPSAIYFNHATRLFPYHDKVLDPSRHPYFMEVSQGFSLGLNDWHFYPHVTSRECTFMQGMSDARIPARYFKRGYLCFRVHPIRVGDADGFSSGEWYPDQSETTWEKLGVEAELTTVTKRVRRVASFSWMQFAESMAANGPTHVFLNFINYLDHKSQRYFIDQHNKTKGKHGFGYEYIYGFGPGVEDITRENSSRIEGI